MKLSEYIIMRRVAHIINSLTANPENVSKSKYYSHYSEDMTSVADGVNFTGFGSVEDKILFQRRLEDTIRLCCDGCGFSRFIAVDKNPEVFKNSSILALYLVEVFEPSHCYIPIIATEYSILAVSPFNNLSIEKVSKNPYVVELLPTGVITDSLTSPGLEKLNELLDNEKLSFNKPNAEENEDTTLSVSYKDFVRDMLLLFNEGVKRQDSLLTRGFDEVDASLVKEVSTESVYFTKMRKLFSLEDFDHGEQLSNDGIISVTDFMPIYVTHKGDTGYAVLSETKKEDGRTVSSLAIKPFIAEGTGRNPILTKDNTAGVSYFILELHDFHYTGDGNIVHYDYMNAKIEEVVPVLDTFVYAEVATNGGNLNDISEESIKSKLAGAVSGVKDAAFVLKKFGLKHGSNAAGFISQLFKQVGVKNAKWCLSQFGATFKRGIDLEKADALELQEKLLNDELDSIEERVVSYSKTWFKSVSLTVFFGGIIWFPLAWMISRYRTKKARVNAMERLEVRLDNIIERLERKINYAEERSENESVDQLIKERQMYQMARMRLLKLKDDAYNRGRVKYATFDKDLTMTADQRVDAYLVGSRNNNYQ